MKLSLSLAGSCVLCSNVLTTNLSHTIISRTWARSFAAKYVEGQYTTPEYASKTAETSAQDGSRINIRKELRFLDSLRIFCRAGKGGDGYPKKNGTGGPGGDITMIAGGKRDITLTDVRKMYPTKRFAAANGMHAKLFTLFGEPGKSFTIRVPLGVTAYHGETNEKLGEINEPGDQVVLARGGAGGSAENGYSGQMGESHVVVLDLKVIADVGFVGFPNAGKSTLLKALSRASPRIASYPFTTVRPNIGVIKYPDDRLIALADLPGLIEGAHINQGMGHKFLKHVERTKILLFVVDLHGFQLGPRYPYRNALETITLLNKELELYRDDLIQKPAILVLNKMDLPDSFGIIERVRDVFFDEDTYRAYVETLPKEYQPEKLMKFDAIIPVSAAKDNISVNNLKKMIRKVIDVNHDYEQQKMLEEAEEMRRGRRNRE